MPRQPRLDAPGTLHHVIGRGIEGTEIFRNEGDRKEFVSRVAACRQLEGVSRARRLFCRVAVEQMGYPAAEVARFLGVTTSAVVRAAHLESLPEIEKYL